MVRRAGSARRSCRGTGGSRRTPGLAGAAQSGRVGGGVWARVAVGVAGACPGLGPLGGRAFGGALAELGSPATLATARPMGVAVALTAGHRDHLPGTYRPARALRSSGRFGRFVRAVRLDGSSFRRTVRVFMLLPGVLWSDEVGDEVRCFGVDEPSGAGTSFRASQTVRSVIAPPLREHVQRGFFAALCGLADAVLDEPALIDQHRRLGADVGL